MKPEDFFLNEYKELPKTFCDFNKGKDCKTCGKYYGVYYRNEEEKIHIRIALQDRHNKLRQQQFDSLQLRPIKDQK